MVQVTGQVWLSCTYMVKTFKNPHLQNRWTDFTETWYVASGTLVYSYINHDLWFDLNLFYGKFKFGHICFSMRKVETFKFLLSFVACDLKVGRYRQLHLIKLMMLCEYSR